MNLEEGVKWKQEDDGEKEKQTTVECFSGTVAQSKNQTFPTQQQ